MSSQPKNQYEGPELSTLPSSISALVTAMIKQLPNGATVELSKLPAKITPQSDVRTYRVVFASDDRGLVQATYSEGNEHFNVRITGMLQRGAREKIMDYHKKRLETLLTPAQSMKLPGPEWLKYPWLSEGERADLK